MKTSYDAAKRKEDELRSSYFGERGRANTQSVSEMGLGELTQRIETNKQLYQTYLQRLNELKVTSSDRSRQRFAGHERRARRASPSGRRARATSSSRCCFP